MDAILAFAGLTKAYLLDIGIGEAEARAIAEQYDMIYDNTLANYAAFRKLSSGRIAPSAVKRCQMLEIIWGGSGSGRAIIVSWR